MKKIISVLIVTLLLLGMIPASAAYDTKTTQAIKGTPVIDGVMDSIWQQANEVNVNLVNQTLIPSNSTTTAKAYTMWDDNYFYFLAVVTDTDVWATGGEGEEVDSVEIAIDETNNKSGQNNVNTTNTAIGVFRVGTNDSQISGFGGKFTTEQSNIKGKSTMTDTGYIVEMAIPWTTITPAEGAIIGMEIQINDSSAGAGRTGLISWNSIETLGWRDTESHGNVVLAAAPAGTETPASTETPQSTQPGDAGVIAMVLLAGASLTGIKKYLRK